MNRHVPKLIAAATAVVTLMLIGAFVLVAGRQVAAQAQPATDLTGRWLLKMSDGPHGPTEMPLTLKQEGATITGVLTPPGHGADFALTGELVKGQLTLSHTASTAEGTMAFTLKATVQADGSLKGFTSSDMGDSTWVATRVK